MPAQVGGEIPVGKFVCPLFQDYLPDGLVLAIAKRRSTPPKHWNYVVIIHNLRLGTLIVLYNIKLKW